MSTEYIKTSWQDGDIITADKMNNIENGIKGVEEVATSLKEDYTTILDSAYVTDTASGSIASFPDGADNVPVKSLVVDIEPVQSGSGDPSPTNIRPISGHDTAKVTRTGKNLLDYADKTISTRITSVTDNGDGSFTVVASGANATIEHIIPVTAGETYTIKCESATNVSGNASQMAVCTVYDGETSSSTALLSNATYDSSAKQFTPTGNYVRVVCKVTGGNGAGTGIIVKPQLELGTTVTPYEPFADIQTVTIDLDGTIYGGTLDVGTGVLTVDRGRVDLGSLTWDKNKNDQGNDVFSSQGIKNAVASSIAVCSAYKNNSETCRPASLYDGEFSINIKPANTSGYFASGEIVIKDSSNAETSSADFKTAMSGIYLAYKIKTPTAVQLNPHEVSTLLGVNNVFADTGNVTAEYRADTKLYIKKLTESTETDMVADANIPNNTYFMVGNQLYLSTAAIASGATIAPGTNCTLTNLATALNALNQ